MNNTVMMMRASLGLLPALLLTGIVGLWVGLSQMPAHAAPFYINDFEVPVGSEWSTTGLTPIGLDTTPSGRQFLGGVEGIGPNLPYGFSNETVTLSLSAPLHEQLTVSFDLFVIQSWDGNGESAYGMGYYGIDIFDLTVGGGPTLLHTTFRNVPYPSQAYPDSYPGAENPPRTGAVENNTLGYDFYGDSVYHFSFTFPHTDSSLVLNFTGSGLQNIQDESWGLGDNLVIDVVTPEPGSLLLWGSGMLAVLAYRRKMLAAVPGFARRRRSVSS